MPFCPRDDSQAGGKAESAGPNSCSGGTNLPEGRHAPADQNLTKDQQDPVPPKGSDSISRLELIAIAIIGCIATVLLFWNLTQTYLWQDEANTAVLAVRVLKYGKPLGYDGKNIITNDSFAAEEQSTLNQRTKHPEFALDYYIQRGDLRPDTTWKFHPYGQFLWAAIGLKVLGQTTLGARVPFVLAALCTVALLYGLVRANCGKALTAVMACTMLILNAYWILHSRQCRYYSLSSCLLVLTLFTYMRWHRGRPWGGTTFVSACWCWFQVDYGSVWPVFGVLFGAAFLHAYMRDKRSCWKVIGLGMALAATLVPFIYYYELWNRKSVQNMTWVYRFFVTGFNINQYIISFILLIIVIIVIVLQRKICLEHEKHFIMVSSFVVISMLFWVPSVAPEIFLRYVIIVAPVGSLLAAWTITKIYEKYSSIFAILLFIVLVFTPWLSKPYELIATPPKWNKTGSWLRGEFSVLLDHVFKNRPDPNRAVVEYLKINAKPSDEILINYEDEPLMFYLPNPIRGGIPAFRVEDDAIVPPRFAVLRRSVPFVHWEVFTRELQRYSWQPIPLRAPDVIWGNIPDPMQGMLDPYHAEDLMLLRRVDGQ